MKMTSRNINLFLLFKLPAAFFSGVRVMYIDSKMCEVTVKHKWINQNPFKSMYFAVQAMAAELSTGALVMNQIGKQNSKISMLVASNKAVFFKKATGLIKFSCIEGDLVEVAIQKAINSNEGQTFWLRSVGTNQEGEKVSEMDFEWTVKVKA